MPKRDCTLTSLALHRHLETAQQGQQQAQQTAQDWQERYRLHQAGIRSLGRPPDFEQRLGWAQQAQQYWEQQVRERQQRQEQVQQAIRGLGDDYHPFDAQTGQAVSAAQMQQRLEQRFETIERLAEQAEVSEAGRQKIAKARRVLPALVASLVWFWHNVHLLVESLEFPDSDYYGDSVALGVAPCRQSRIPCAVDVQDGSGAHFVPL